MKSELEERLRKVEEDRHTVEMYSGKASSLIRC